MMAELIQKKLGIWIIAASIGYQGILAASIAVGVAPIFNNLIKALIMVTLVIASHYLAKKQKGDLHA